MKLSIVIVNYNVKYFLEQVLLSVRKATKGLSMEVFVVDNNSVDESVRMVREKFPEVILIANENNPGFSVANNQAIQQSKGEYVLLLNPDTVVEEDTFVKCIEFMDAHAGAGGLGVRMIDGSGNFLPESKRGFPSPFVAFSKTFGLSKLFPKSKTFNSYHLGYLSEHETNEVDVLAGAFMMLRKSVLDEIGLLDETFFMYGEDIDLSYRIVKAGYKNYYFADTTIIHYKGESTKKGSLNYVKVFHNAMIIFAKKHFESDKARLFVWMLKAGIYFKAILTVLSNFTKNLFLPFIDAALIFIGMYGLKTFWATNYFNNPEYYEETFMTFNVPLYILIWLTGIYLSGGYDRGAPGRKVVRGVLMGSLLLAAVYGFLDLEYRPSRVLIILGAIWALLATVGVRAVQHFLKYRNFNLGTEKKNNLIIVGSKKESERVLSLINQAQLFKNFIGTVSPDSENDPGTYLSRLEQLDEVVRIYKIDEIIYCSKDIPAQNIMQWMTQLGSNLIYKIVPEESASIIGSSSSNSPGELYTIDIQFNIDQLTNRRNKRLLDILLSIGFLFLVPILIFIVKNKSGFLKNIFQILIGKKTWVAYAQTDSTENINIPKIKKGVLSPLTGLKLLTPNIQTIQRLNFLYAKDYEASKDVEIVWRGLKELGS